MKFQYNPNAVGHGHFEVHWGFKKDFEFSNWHPKKLQIL